MSKILKNNTASDILVSDTGVNLLASSSYTIPPTDYAMWASSSDVITSVGNGNITVNDGTFDLSKADAISLLQGNFKQTDFISDLKNNDRLKVEVTQVGGAPNIQVSSNDQSSGYLEAKVVGTSGKIVVSTLNDGGDEDLKINVGSDIFDKTTDTAANVVNTPAGGISATNVQAAINELDAEKANKVTTISAGAGLTGGGDLTTNRTISMPNVGTAGSYGTSSQVPVITTDAQGRVSSVTPTTIDKLYDHWHGTTQYNASQLRKYTNIVNTDANGRVTVNLTQNGNVGGVALFTTLLSVLATGDSPSNSDPLQAPSFFIESTTTTQVVFRGVRGVSQGILLGGTVNTMRYVGSGIPVYIEITGVK